MLHSFEPTIRSIKNVKAELINDLKWSVVEWRHLAMKI